MRPLMISLILLVGVSICSAEELNWKWTKTDTALQVSWSMLHVIDWSQTRYGAKRPEQFEEMNPLLGKHPTTREVDIYFATLLVATPVISRIIPKPYRTYFQVVSIGASGFCVMINFQTSIGTGDFFR